MTTILLIGAGRMGGSMLEGWLSGLDDSFGFHVIDPSAAEHWQHAHTRVTQYSNQKDCPPDLAPDVVVLALKPQLIEPALQAMRLNGLHAPLVVSVAAGVTLSSMKAELLDHQTALRVMPNIGAQVGYSVSTGFAPQNTSPEHLALVANLFEAIGTFTWLETEEQLHTATALSGSGPAYIFAMCEALTAAGQAQGLSNDTAKMLAVGTISAAGRLLEDTPNPTELRQSVTSPNGTTHAGLEVLQRDKSLERLIAQTLSAARMRSIALSET